MDTTIIDFKEAPYIPWVTIPDDDFDQVMTATRGDDDEGPHPRG